MEQLIKNRELLEKCTLLSSYALNPYMGLEFFDKIHFVAYVHGDSA